MLAFLVCLTLLPALCAEVHHHENPEFELELLDGEEAPADSMVDATPPGAVRANRPATTPPAAAIEVARHQIDARIDPDEHRLSVEDTITLIARQEGAQEIHLYTTLVTVNAVESALPLTWETRALPAANQLTISFKDALPVGEPREVIVRTSSTEFFEGTDQQLVAEIGVVGQIRPRSSWSSHVVWYPIDQRNDAAMDITLDVPDAMTGVTGGTPSGCTRSDGRARYRYVEDFRTPRILPFGFAVADYVTAEVVSEGGVHFHVFGYRGEEALIQQRVEVLAECARAFERALGPLPWSHVHFVHVTPESKETGVSLPGMILVSDAYFPDLDGVDGSSGDLSDPSVLGLLVVADELSHQWNIYASGFPNELGEGISTYTNALFLEIRHGKDAYDRTLRYCRDAWVKSAGKATEYAIANMAVYTNARYRPVVFCKTPVVFDALRRHLGDAVFFDGLRRSFAIRDTATDGFARLEQGFSDAAEQDLRPFFDQWFFRAGFPTVEVSHRDEDGAVVVMLRQVQDEAPYTLDVEVALSFADGTTDTHEVVLREREETLRVTVDRKVTAVTLGPQGLLPARVVVR